MLQKQPLNEAPCFALYGYKQFSNEESSVYLLSKDRRDSLIANNERAKRQDGTFTYFTKPCSFYLEGGEFPSIKHYENEFKQEPSKRTFDLVKCTIKKSPNTIHCLKQMLEEKKINKDYLFPDLGSLNNRINKDRIEYTA